MSQRRVWVFYVLFVLSATLVNFYARGSGPTVSASGSADSAMQPSEVIVIDAWDSAAGRLLKNGVRLGIAALLLSAVAWRTGVWSLPREQWWRYAVVSLLTIALPQGAL